MVKTEQQLRLKRAKAYANAVFRRPVDPLIPAGQTPNPYPFPVRLSQCGFKP